jgi:adenylate kinase
LNYLFSYPEAKIKENIECEIMEVTSEEVKESYDNSIILELKSNIPEDMEANLEKAIKFIEEHHGLITED